MVTKEDWESIAHLEPKWKGLQMSGSVDLNNTEKQQIDVVYKKIFNLKGEKGYSYECPTCVLDAFTKTFIHYDAYRASAGPGAQKEQPKDRTPRPRLGSASELFEWVKNRL